MNNTEPFVESISDYFEKIRSGQFVDKHSYVDRFISPFFEKSVVSRFCSAGEGTLSVSTAGIIYTCFYFTDQEEEEIAIIEEEVESIKDKILVQREISYRTI